MSYEPADMVGHVWLLQIGTPLVGSISWTIFSMPPRTRYCSETVKAVSTARVSGEKDETVRTLMSQPFTLLHQLRLQGESHEIAPCYEACIFVAEEEWCPVELRCLVGMVSRLVLGHAR